MASFKQRKNSAAKTADETLNIHSLLVNSRKLEVQYLTAALQDLVYQVTKVVLRLLNSFIGI